MAQQKKGLGKGLKALLDSSQVSINDVVSTNKVEHISLDEIQAGQYQMRTVFAKEALEELANSIKINGVVQPIILRRLLPLKKDSIIKYEIIAGERRFRASKIAGLTTIPALIKELTDKEALAISLIENLQRRDLNAIEEANGYKRLIDEFNLTHEELANLTSKSRSHTSNILRLLNLNPKVQELMLTNSKLAMGHARALLPLSLDLQLKVAFDVINKSLTTKEVEYIVNKLLNLENVKNLKLQDPDISRLENSMADKAGMAVKIKHGKKGSGSVTFKYASLDELDNLIRLFDL